MNENTIDVLILAGGKAQRLNGVDKGLTIVNGKPLIQHCVERLCYNNLNLIISANRNQEKYACYADHIASDTIGDFKGPLAGIYSALNFVQSEHLLVIPCDMPFSPLNLYFTLKNKINNSNTCAIVHEGRIEPLLLLVKRNHIASIINYLNNGRRSVIGWLKTSQCTYVEQTGDSIQFFNINTSQDIALANALMKNACTADLKKDLTDTKNLFLPTILQ